MNFKDLGLSEQTIKAIEEIGIAKPTTVQKDVIPSILEGKDIFTIAPGRCGKTCSYVFPLIDIISRQQGQNILIITADSAQSVAISDRLAVFNKYHEVNEETLQEKEQEINQEANVIIAAPDLLLDIAAEGRIDLSNINILVVDDINLIKKKRQLENLEKVLEMLPADKQNIVFTNRRSKETQGILDKILKAPAEIKVDRTKEDEAANIEAVLAQNPDQNKAAAENEDDVRRPVESQPHNENPQTLNENKTNVTDSMGQSEESQAARSEKRSRRHQFKQDKRNRQNGDASTTSGRESKESNFKQPESTVKQHSAAQAPQIDEEAVELMKRFKTFGDKTPEFLLIKGELVKNEY